MRDHISVCICTFRRNDMLQRLLKRVSVQLTDNLFDYSVVVIDNDSTGPAREVVSHFDRMRIIYDIEPERTIPAARNHALRLATGNYMAIIDDDEFPPADWLLKMYRVIDTFDVDGALGPIHPFFERKPPAWLIKGKFCERPIYRTGTLLDWNQTRTGNVLLKRHVFDEHLLQFDLKWKTSGSDRAFFRQAIELGYKFIAIEDAPVYEMVPPERWTSNYYIKRALVHGFNSFRNRKVERFGFHTLSIIIKSLVVLLTYILAFPFSVLLGKHLVVKCLESGSYHLSRLLAIFRVQIIKTRDF